VYAQNSRFIQASTAGLGAVLAKTTRTTPKLENLVTKLRNSMYLHNLSFQDQRSGPVREHGLAVKGFMEWIDFVILAQLEWIDQQ